MPSGRYSRAARSEESELSDDEDGPDDSAQQVNAGFNASTPIAKALKQAS